ncbi:16S/23S rRNA (cytidine-2'-O)-methyltransferase TlyA [Clostridium saccharobutylicum]|uniref:TlyA family RNA methyltransferase n=1 Tax=Clostridium saccharobutylicum TaxID=169679 RepID=UPI0009840467|nr:TlyA family RNA methyltransferase [Clostridium saccharobutylicum]AQS10512.1 16S/23S rRNA (cytidine-2'-O)-methyltransferase TlyA [Clostridium saccharobutylicum]MBC2438463.1 TlyA family RNA methyltransferase [Clostridium saccharobutylicum]NSB90819.1 23S rRNA (cytidine1920-2'-O)/16S rRNA (cytidine1409-2'-O)-methyltransferase [Clostridium saccharobutylicum]NYC31465.1 23S rRNA (cytidine1920-2'-O)/16S rRNA (cytidine1409-2'-O)-methyltransferase [Clostridium saccharobutylicum]OOM18405.1 16S/23S rRN
MAEKKERLDLILVEKGIITSRERAKACIMEGKVYVNGQKVDKAGEKVSYDADIEYRGATLKYVSRGGLKLEKAMNSYYISLEGKVCMDIGASTGGFTDCMLQNGASKVFSVDVGYGQFAWKLRTDERVVCMERTNIRYVTPEDIGELLDFASIDVSFISLKKIMPATLNLLKDDGEVVALIKPQFEAGREKVGKKGVVREKETHKEVVHDIVNFLLEQDLNVLGVGYSPIKGPEGNREYLVYFSKDKNKESDFKNEDIDVVVEASHVEI